MSRFHLPTDEQIDAVVRPYGFQPSSEFCEKTRIYIGLLLKWNQRVALTSVTSISEILRVHFGESLFAISAADIAVGRLADVGSGAGFPGVPLATGLPRLEVNLIESNAKKAAFLSELVRALQLTNSRVHHGRAESMGGYERFDIVSARAVGEYQELLKWSEVHLKRGGKAILWLGVRQVEQLAGIHGWAWQSPLQVPNTKGRFILVGSVRGSF